MTALALTPQPDTASVLLEVTGAPAGPVTITRADTNGTGPVRLLADQEPIGGALTVTDYEAALAGGLTYTLVDAASAVVTASTTLDGAVLRPWLSVPVSPQLGRQVLDVLDDYTADQEARGQLHQVIDATEPVPTLAPLSARTGSLSVLALDHTEARAIAAVYGRGEVVQLRQLVPGLDMYHVATRVAVRLEEHVIGHAVWRVAVSYAEVARPGGSLLGGLGWDFAELAGAYPDFASVTAAFEDFAALTAGPP